jgi:hypothetical protein
MLLTVLSVPDCPNASVLVERLRDRIDDRTDHLLVITVDDDEQATRWGMTGSPTLLIDGVDPFASLGGTPSIACRLYREDATVAGVPPESALDAALSAARTKTKAEAHANHGWIDPWGRAGRGRRAPAEGGLRATQTALLRSIAATGRLPAPEDLDSIAAGFHRRGADVLRELAAEDYLTLDTAGLPRAIYPLAAAPTRHRVRIAEGQQVWAMCAIDALGIAPMLNQVIDIDTSDPLTNDPIDIRVTPHRATSSRPGTVVVAGRSAEAGPAERICCDAINFFASAHSAARWMATHPGIDGQVLDIDQATEIARTIFADLLRG